MRKITNVLRELRDQNRKTQEYMASRLGISQSQYNKIEKGDKPLDFDMLANISKIFNIPSKQLYQLIYEEETTTRHIHVVEASSEKPRNTEDEESQDGYYKKMAVYFERKFLKTYRMYIEIVNKYRVDMPEAS